MMRAYLGAFLGLVVSAGTAAAQCTIPNTLTNGNNADATQVMANFNALLTCLNGLPSATPVTPQGRLTLVSVTPVMSSNQANKTVVYYTPYGGNRVPIYSGTSMVPTSFAELSNVLANGASGNAGPAAAVQDSNYDLFVWSNAGTLTLTRGPAWASNTARDSGGSTYDLQVIDGVWTNKYAITNGPDANLGTYVGTVRTNPSSATIDWNPGGIATGGTPAMLGVWNAYNRVTAAGFIGDSNSSWVYSGGTWHSANSSNGMRVSFVQGLKEDFVEARYSAIGFVTGGIWVVGVGLGTTSSPSGQRGVGGNTGTVHASADASHRVQQLGFSYLQALEINVTAGATFFGSGVGGMQSGLSYRGDSDGRTGGVRRGALFRWQGATRTHPARLEPAGRTCP